ncbi:MAG: thioredoxin domain-containing protein [Rhodospirillales bacterium]|nr:thioredoxin domain-containing protein [Rhodospirillales bacterium]
MSRNLLAQEISPYLLQHKDNPVHWRPWGPDALAEARREDKPILLSVGYAACHWCHVMAHESFESDEIARLMNERFVSVKVDREERPDIDGIYQSALALMGERGGWPLTMFLTPDGEPFWGGTYFPPTPRYGRPGFPQLLQAIADAYRSDRAKVETNVTALRAGLSKMQSPEPGTGLTMQTLDEAAQFALRLVDAHKGGTSGAPKFPQPTFFRFLWRAYKRSGETALGEAVTTTLDAICQGGIYDHLAGGFARYATDEIWLVPHFEKMLYDNALLVDLLTEVWLETRTPLYARRIAETVDWLMTEMRVDAPDGGSFAFASALDADSEGEEGKYYVWSEAEIDAILGGDAAAFKAAYDVRPGGNWEGQCILNRIGAAGLANDEAVLARCRERLLAVRRRRVAPGRDDKVLADWNGLTIAALAGAGAVFEQPGWIEAAAAAFRFVTTRMSDGQRLRHVWRAGIARHPGVLEDYANMSRAALSLFQVTGERAYLDQAEAWVAVADRHFRDRSAGGYFTSADDTTDVITRPKAAFDNAVPSGNGTMIEVLAGLFFATGTVAYRDAADAAVQVFSGSNPQYLLGVPGLMTAYEILVAASQVVIVHDPGDPVASAFRSTALQSPSAVRFVMSVEADGDLPAGHPAAGKPAIDGAATAYVCTGQTCGPPSTTPAELLARLADAAPAAAM